MENRAEKLICAALADVKIQLKKGDYQKVADKANLSLRTVRNYIYDSVAPNTDRAKAILVAATEVIKQREADIANAVESYNLIKE